LSICSYATSIKCIRGETTTAPWRGHIYFRFMIPQNLFDRNPGKTQSLFCMYNQLVCYSRVLLQKLIIAQLANKFSGFYETRRFITGLQESTSDLSPESGESSSPLHTMSLIPVLIISSNYFKISQEDTFFSGSPTELLFSFLAFIISPYVLHVPPISS
jgi:hypothetical protein